MKINKSTIYHFHLQLSPKESKLAPVKVSLIVMENVEGNKHGF